MFCWAADLSYVQLHPGKDPFAATVPYGIRNMVMFIETVRPEA